MAGSSEFITDIRGVALVALGAVPGALLAAWLGVPAPFLTGPAAVVSIMAVAGLPVRVPLRLRDLCFLLIGVGMGSGLTPEAVRAAAQWPVPLAGLIVAMVVIALAGARILKTGFGFERASAILGATPGHLSFVLAMTEEIKGDTARVAVVQSLRVLYLTLLVPFAVQAVVGGDLGRLPEGPAPMHGLALVGLLLAGGALGLVLLRLKVPAALLLAGMGMSAAAHATGIVTGTMPTWLAIAAFVTMGGLIGTRFAGVSLAQIRQAMVASLALTALALAVTVAMSELVHGLTGLPRVDLLIALAPGGLETMAVLSLMLGADPAFVAVHHLVRLLFLSLFVPFILFRR